MILGHSPPSFFLAIIVLAVLDSSFLGLLLLLFALQQPVTLAAAGFLCALYAAIRSKSFSVGVNLLTFVLSITVALMVAVIIGANHGYSSIFYLFSTVSAFYAAKQFGSCSLRHVKLCLEMVFWAAVAGIALCLMLRWDVPEPLGEIIPGSSTNGLPSYLIVLQVALAISVFLERDRLPVLSAIATFIVAVFGLGRGSIVVSALVVSFSILVNIFMGWTFRRKKRYWGWLVLLACGAAGAGGYYLWQAGVIDPLLGGTKWAWGVLDPPRAQMLEDYLDKLDWLSLWVGADYSGTSIETLYGGNPHNSYIRLHSYYGLVGLLLVVLSPILILVSDKIAHIKNVVFVLVLLVLLRAATEPIFFPSALDFLYCLYFVMFLKHAPSKPVLGGQDLC